MADDSDTMSVMNSISALMEQAECVELQEAINAHQERQYDGQSKSDSKCAHALSHHSLSVALLCAHFCIAAS